MSHFGDYGGGSRRPERWDPERFNRERGGRQVLERERLEDHERFSPRGGDRRDSSYDDFHYTSRSGGGRFEEKDRYLAEERYGPPARRSEGRQARYYEEEDVDSFESSPTRGVGPIVPFEGRQREIFHEREYRPRHQPPRPGIVRRQSSLDTFDRRPMPRYPPPRGPPETITMPAPGRHRRSPPRYEREFEEIRVAEPDYYGDENFRGYKEREVSTVRRRRGSEARGSEIEFKEKEEFAVEEEEPFPRRGKTKMPGRLVNKRAIIELGYPFEEEASRNVLMSARRFPNFL